MPTETPPPYFPQGSLSPPDARRYRKFKLILFGLGALLLLLAAGVVAVFVYLAGALR